MAVSPPYHAIMDVYCDSTVRPLFVNNGEGFNADYRNTKAAIYGSNEDELMKELEEFRQFAGSCSRLGRDSQFYFFPIQPYNVHRNGVQVAKYTYKSFCFNAMMEKLPADEDPFVTRIVKATFSEFFKHCEAKLKGYNEQCPYIEEKFNELRRSLIESAKLPCNEMTTDDTTIRHMTILIAKKFKKTCPEVNAQCLKFIFGIAAVTRPVLEHRPLYQKVTHIIIQYLEVLVKFIKKEELMLQPNKELEGGSQEKVRMFTQGEKKFVLIREILREWKAIGAVFPDELEERLGKKLKNDPLATMSVEDLEATWSDNIKNKSFEDLTTIDVLIKRTKHRGIWVPSFENKYCILVSDAYLELLRYLISVRGIFQVVDDTNWSTFIDIFKLVKHYKKMDADAIMLVDVDYDTFSRGIIGKQVTQVFSELLDNVQRVNPIGDEGFTLDDLKAEIRRLNINTAFPNIMSHTKTVFEQIRKKTNVMRTCDMYDALEQCQLLAFFTKFEERYNWLRNQGALHIPPFSYNKEEN